MPWYKIVSWGRWWYLKLYNAYLLFEWLPSAAAKWDHKIIILSTSYFNDKEELVKCIQNVQTTVIFSCYYDNLYTCTVQAWLLKLWMEIWKTVHGNGSLSYQGRLNIQLTMLIIDSSLIFQQLSIQCSANKTYFLRNCNMVMHLSYDVTVLCKFICDSYQ